MSKVIQSELEKYTIIFWNEFKRQSDIPIKYFKPIPMTRMVDYQFVINTGPMVRSIAMSDLPK
jgi:hypothetical protein